MEWRDLVPVLIAVVIVIIIALFVKPMLGTGEEDSSPFITIPFLGEEPTPTPKPTPIAPPPSIPGETPVPTPTPRWDGETQSLSFVDPSIYHLDDDVNPLVADVPGGIRPSGYDLETYATIKGRWSGTTEIIRIPYPYWELHYTVEALTDPGSVFPSINIQVMDANDPNRFVRVINPGILDPNLWSESDPRPWMEKFYEGEKDYYLVITTRFVQSYQIDIKVPKNIQ